MIASYSTLIEQKNPVLPFSRKMRPFGKKFLYHLLLNLMGHAYAKFTPLDITGKQMTGKRGKPNIPFIVGKLVFMDINALLMHSL